MTMFPALGALFDTVKHSKKDILVFFIVSFFFNLQVISIMSFGFIVTAYLKFGPVSKLFSTLLNSIVTSFNMIMGNESVNSIDSYEPSLKAMFYIMFMILFNTLFLKMFMSIVIITYSNLRESK
jgi:hypothetical protein